VHLSSRELHDDHIELPGAEREPLRKVKLTMGGCTASRNQRATAVRSRRASAIRVESPDP
jgi:hypothetical protein